MDIIAGLVVVFAIIALIVNEFSGKIQNKHKPSATILNLSVFIFLIGSWYFYFGKLHFFAIADFIWVMFGLICILLYCRSKFIAGKFASILVSEIDSLKKTLILKFTPDHLKEIHKITIEVRRARKYFLYIYLFSFPITSFYIVRTIGGIPNSYLIILVIAIYISWFLDGYWMYPYDSLRKMAKDLPLFFDAIEPAIDNELYVAAYNSGKKKHSYSYFGIIYWVIFALFLYFIPMLSNDSEFADIVAWFGLPASIILITSIFIHFLCRFSEGPIVDYIDGLSLLIIMTSLIHVFLFSILVTFFGDVGFWIGLILMPVNVRFVLHAMSLHDKFTETTHGNKLFLYCVCILLLAAISIEGFPRLQSKNFISQAEQRLTSGDMQLAKEKANMSIASIDTYYCVSKQLPILSITPRKIIVDAKLILAQVAIASCNLSEASMHLNSLSKFNGFGSKKSEINSLLLRFDLYSALGMREKRNELIETAYEKTSETLNKSYWTALVNRYRAKLAIEQGHYEEAVNILYDIRKVGKQIGSYTLISSAMCGWGDAYYKKGRFSEAKESYAEALKFSQKFKAKGDEALYLLKLAMSEKELGNLKPALQHLTGAVNIVREVSSKEVLWQSLYQKGLILRDEGKQKEALDSFLEAIGIIDTVRGGFQKEEYRLGYMANKIPVYESAVSIASQMENDYKAFTYAQKAKSRVFLDLLGTREVAYHEKDHELAQKERQFQIKINVLSQRIVEEQSKPERLQSGKLKEWKEELQKVLNEHSQILAEIKRTNPRLASLTTTPTVNISDVQNVLHRDEIFLEYFVLDDKTMLWAITKEEVKTFEISIGRDRLKTMVSKIREPITHNITPSITELNEAYKDLLGPVSVYLERKRHVIIALHDKLYLLPFETLVVAKGTPTYVVDRWFVSYYPSASVLVLNRKYQEKKELPAKPLFAVGDPVFSTDDPRYPSKDKKAIQVAMADEKKGAIYRRVWMDDTVKPVTGDTKVQVVLDRLNATGSEVKAISRLWGVSEEEDNIKLGVKATEKEVKEADHTKYRYEHYATHGVLRGDIPGLKEPALVFSLPNAQDMADDEGFLTMSEIFGLRTNADMVTLSACKTALGEETPGEGLVGLTRAFMYAGTPSVVASLWSVADQSTADLMTAYYKHLKQGKNKAEALSLAKRSLKKGGYHNPFYWAPFILVGEK